MALLEKQAEYKAKLTECLQETTISSDDDLDSRWNKLTSAIHKTAEEVFGKTSRKQLKDWYDTECQEATKAKNEAYVYIQQRNHTRASTDKYREARRKEKQLHKKKRQYECQMIIKYASLCILTD